MTMRQRAHSSGPVGLVPASSDMQGDGNLLCSLLLKYRGGYQLELTCKHMAIQVEGLQVTAWKRSRR